MRANPITDSDELVTTLIERAVEEVFDEAGDENVNAEQLHARTQMRFAELTMPYRQGIDTYLAETVSATLVDVAERTVLTGGAEPFSVEKVVDESMAKLERTLGAPDDRSGARIAIRAYLEKAHGLSQQK